MELTDMISVTFKFGGFWSKVRNEERMKYNGGKQKTIKLHFDMITFESIKQEFTKLCPWIGGHNVEFTYHVPRTSPKQYKLLENEDDSYGMAEQIKDHGCVQIVVSARNINEDIMYSNDVGASVGRDLDVVCNNSDNIIPEVNQYESDALLSVGAQFSDATSFKNALRSHAIKNNFGVKIKASDRKRVIATCSHHGCPWRIRASLCSDGDYFEVRRLDGTHICPGMNSAGNNQATISWVANEIQDLVKGQPNIPPKQINKTLERTYGLSLPYMKLWRSREIAREIAFGSVDESYSWVPTLKYELLMRNPGSHILYTFDENDCSFQRFFVSLKVCIDGFLLGCRPLVGIDACHLKSKYLVVLLSATSLDGNNGLFTLAFAVVETESKKTWKWFLEHLTQCFGFDLFPLAFISDMEKGIFEAIKEVFPFAEHRVCLRHLWKNLKKHFHCPEGRNIQDLVWATANANKSLEFNVKMDLLGTASPVIYSYLKNLPYKWSRSQFLIDIKHDCNTNNMSESFNSWIAEARDKPVVDLIDTIRGMIMEQRATRKLNGLSWKYDLVPLAEEHIRCITTRKEHFIIRQSFVSVAEVEGVQGRHEVDIDSRRCSCRVWELTGLPCIHAAAFIVLKPHPFWHTYVDDHYHVERYKAAYDGAISTMPSREQWQFVDDGVQIGVPTTSRPRGRPKKKRFKGFLEAKRQHKCSRCGLWGHHRGSCKNPLKTSMFRRKLTVRRESNMTNGDETLP